jgi:RimJ/RimL family protein N-acetyltransferase
MENISVRKATLHDLETLLRFEQGIIEAERPFDETLKTGRTQYYDLAAMLQSQNVALVMAERNNGIVGSGYARIEDAKPYNQHSRHAYLGFMYVPEVHRGKGINALIMDALKSWALSKGVTELRLDVYHDNLAAIRAYEKAGFQILMINMRMGLTNDGPPAET